MVRPGRPARSALPRFSPTPLGKPRKETYQRQGGGFLSRQPWGEAAQPSSRCLSGWQAGEGCRATFVFLLLPSPPFPSLSPPLCSLPLPVWLGLGQGGGVVVGGTVGSSVSVIGQAYLTRGNRLWDKLAQVGRGAQPKQNQKQTQSMQIILTVTASESFNVKKTGELMNTIYGFEAAPATLRQVVRCLVPRGTNPPPLGSQIRLEVHEVSVFNGRVDMRGRWLPVDGLPTASAAAAAPAQSAAGASARAR